jgi:uncharacterized protein (UPF0303 family)
VDADDLAGTLPDSLPDLAEQERRLSFDRFDNGTAWRLGRHLVEAAAADDLPVTIGIRRGHQRLFHAALPGTSPDNDAWVERKSRVVISFGRSSLHVAEHLGITDHTAPVRPDLPTALYAAAGGSFPITVDGVGVVGAVTVSGLPHREDHQFLVRELARFFRTEPSELSRRPAPSRRPSRKENP